MELQVSLKNAGRLWKLSNVVSMTKVADGTLLIKIQTGQSRYRCSRTGDTLVISDNKIINVYDKQDQTILREDSK